MCGAPGVLNMLLNDFQNNGQALSSTVQFALGGAAPPSPVIRRAQEVGFSITHLYGLTETYGPSTLCVWQNDWAQLPTDALALKMRSEEHTSELQSLMRNSYADFCLKKKTTQRRPESKH